MFYYIMFYLVKEILIPRQRNLSRHPNPTKEILVGDMLYFRKIKKFLKIACKIRKHII